MFLIKTMRFVAVLDKEMCECSHDRGHEIHHHNPTDRTRCPLLLLLSRGLAVSSEWHNRAGLHSKTSTREYNIVHHFQYDFCDTDMLSQRHHKMVNFITVFMLRYNPSTISRKKSIKSQWYPLEEWDTLYTGLGYRLTQPYRIANTRRSMKK